MKCSICGCNDTEENPVTKGPDPYNNDINDDDTPVWECSSCRQDRAGDI